tara:strand:- start:9905 stop:10582 length:678 start_codon:yes stop_codon:yes gene_type:complete
MSELLRIEALCKTYEDGQDVIQVLKEVSFSVMQGESLAIVGESGSGKSTLLHIMGTLDYPTSGRIFFQNENVAQFSGKQKAYLRNQHMGFIYQFHHLLSEFDAQENVAMPAWIAGRARAEALKDAQALLKKVGLGHRMKHRPSELSGGERQRVAIARALINQPRLVLADEPTGNLDAQSGRAVYELMCQLTQETGTSFVVVTHDQNLAHQLDRKLMMYDGQLKGA